ncbi:MAG TPA: hypothetical protein DCG57_02640 [Candidatus Riflebacteria bacterium]|jgi:hypothetical protein|nr:hypothetical protein [Candidatus Riflebacteria bacterium]
MYREEFMKYLLPGMLIILCLCSQAASADEPFTRTIMLAANPLTSADEPITIEKSPQSSSEHAQKKKGGLLSGLKSFGSSVVDFVKDKKDKVSHGFNEVCKIVPKLTRIRAFFKQKTLSDKDRKKLEELAEKNKSKGWPLDGDIADVVNAHYTNTYGELKKALESDCNWFECDVRPEGPLREYVPFMDGEPRPVTAHDSFQTNGMLFEDWVRIVAKSGRGIKVDLKDNSSLDGVLAVLKKYNIDERRLILNINVSQPGSGPKAENDARIKAIRKAFPGCRIKLSPGGGSSVDGKYTMTAADRLIEYAKAAGQPIMYAMRAEWVTPELVKKLEPYGKVSIWNSTSTFDPVDVAKEVARFRSWGVTGMVDLMSTHKK